MRFADGWKGVGVGWLLTLVTDRRLLLHYATDGATTITTTPAKPVATTATPAISTSTATIPSIITTISTIEDTPTAHVTSPPPQAPPATTTVLGSVSCQGSFDTPNCKAGCCKSTGNNFYTVVCLELQCPSGYESATPFAEYTTYSAACNNNYDGYYRSCKKSTIVATTTTITTITTVTSTTKTTTTTTVTTITSTITTTTTATANIKQAPTQAPANRTGAKTDTGGGKVNGTGEGTVGGSDDENDRGSSDIVRVYYLPAFAGSAVRIFLSRAHALCFSLSLFLSLSLLLLNLVPACIV